MPLLKFKPVDRARENNGLLGGEKFKYPAKRNSVKMLDKVSYSKIIINN